MGAVYVIPGYLCTELNYDRALLPRLWVSESKLILGSVGAMRLAPDGVSPGPPDGEPLLVGGLLASTWATALELLNNQLTIKGYHIVPWPWDFRKEIIGQAIPLALRIVATATPSSPATIVGHSAGGLLGTIVWQILNSQGQANLIRRIVTLGSPFAGTYYGPLAMTGSDPSLQTVIYWNNVLGGALQFEGASPVKQWTMAELINLVLTWPSFYELFPSLVTPDASNDPNRVDLYSSANWPSPISASQPWLNLSRYNFQPSLSGPEATLPPWQVMSNVIGTGYETASKLTNPRALLDSASYAKVEDGDNVVTVSSAQVARAVKKMVQVDHNSMPAVTIASGLVAGLVVAEYPPDPPPPDPPPPVPPVQTIPGANAPVIGAPPGQFFLLPNGNDCAQGNCAC